MNFSISSSLLNATQPKMNLTLNSSAQVNIIGNPKRTFKKLARFKAQQGQTQTQDESEKRRQSTITKIINCYEYCFQIIGDGNQLYRVVGMNLLKNIYSSQAKIDQFINNFKKKVVDPKKLRNYSKEFQSFCSKEKLMKTLVTIIRSYDERPSSNFNRGMSYLLNNYSIFDFALVAIVRLYTYYYEKVDLNNEEYIDFEDFIVDFNVEATSEIIKLISQCFKTQIQIYSISPEIGLMNYLPNVKDGLDPIALMQIRTKYNLLEKKGQYQKPNPAPASVQQKQFIQQNSPANQWILQKKDSQNSIYSSIKIDFKKKPTSNSIVFEGPNQFHKQNKPIQQQRPDQPLSRESMKLSKISKVESEYRTKIMTPIKQQQSVIRKVLSLNKIEGLTIFPRKEEVVEPPKPTLEHYSSLKTLSKVNFGKIRKQFMSPPVTNRSNHMGQKTKYDFSKLYRASSRPNLQQVEDNPYYQSRFSKNQGDKKIVIHTKNFEIEVFKK